MPGSSSTIATFLRDLGADIAAYPLAGKSRNGAGLGIPLMTKALLTLSAPKGSMNVTWRTSMDGKSDEQMLLLATLPPTPRQRQLALAIVLALLIAFVITAPFRAIQFPRSDAFIAAFQAVLFVSDLITATFLFAQFSILSWRSLLVLASGYLFTAVIAIPYALTFPGLFSPTGLLG